MRGNCLYYRKEGKLGKGEGECVCVCGGWGQADKIIKSYHPALKVTCEVHPAALYCIAAVRKFFVFSGVFFPFSVVLSDYCSYSVPPLTRCVFQM